MASKAQQMSSGMRLATNLFVLIWLMMAAFPFLWTFWGSFKVELDFQKVHIAYPLPARGAVNLRRFQLVLRQGLQPGVKDHKCKGR